MKIRIITQLEAVDGTMKICVYGEHEGKETSDEKTVLALGFAATLLKERIKKAVHDFDPEKIMLGDVAKLMGDLAEAHKAAEDEVSHE